MANIWLYVLPREVLVPAIRVSVKMLWGSRLYRNILSLVGNRRVSDGCETCLTPRCVVRFTVRFARSMGICQRIARVRASTALERVEAIAPGLVRDSTEHTLTWRSSADTRLWASDMSAYGWANEVIALMVIGVSCRSWTISSPQWSVKVSSCSWYKVLAGSQVSVSLVKSMRGYKPESHSLVVGLCTGK